MRRYRAGLLVGLGAVAITAAVAGAGLLVWRGPWWFDGNHLDDAKLKDGSAALVTGFRAAVVQLLAVLGAGVALLFTAFNYRLTRRGQVTDRFTKALERLGSPEMYVRLGGILALEQIVQDAPDQADDAARVLNAFIRQHAPTAPPPRAGATITGRDRITTARRNARSKTPQATAPVPSPPARPAADVQQALAALTRPTSRKHTTHQPGLQRLHLKGAELSSADLTGTRLGGANLTSAWLDRANLTSAWLGGANLTGAWLGGANLTGAWLDRANLTDARLDGANLTDTWLDGANLTDARLDRTNLRGCVGLTVEQVNSAFTTPNTQLPPEIASHPDLKRRTPA